MLEVDARTARAALVEQHRLLTRFVDDVDASDVAAFATRLARCRGTVVLTGVGKSGFICQKIAASFASIGLRATYLDPLGALHGDLGNVRDGDVVVMFSKSGSTEELLKLVPPVSHKGATTVAVTCSAHNSLSKLCDMHVHLPLEKELCVFNLAPVTSTVVQLTFGDTVTALLMEHFQLSKESYYLNHPAGSIGRKLSLCVDDVMCVGDKMPVVSTETTLSDALAEMSRCVLGCVLLKNADDSLAGIFTDGDLRRLLTNARGVCDLSMPMSRCMTTNVRFVEAASKLVDVKHVFFEPTPVTVVPVIRFDHGRTMRRIVGVLTASTTCQSLE